MTTDTDTATVESPTPITFYQIQHPRPDASGNPVTDTLLIGLSDTPRYNALRAWQRNTPELHPIIGEDYHRLTLEHWLWSHRAEFGEVVMDVGVEYPRRWVGPGYFTLGLTEDEDVWGDVTALPLDDDNLDTVICTEVLEHCADPFTAVREIYRVLRPGGRLFITSPFLWPDHHTERWPDYWRFTRQGWERLLTQVTAFRDVEILRVPWTDEGAVLYNLLRKFEGFGFSPYVEGATAYLCSATK